MWYRSVRDSDNPTLDRLKPPVASQVVKKVLSVLPYLPSQDTDIFAFGLRSLGVALSLAPTLQPERVLAPPRKECHARHSCDREYRNQVEICECAFKNFSSATTSPNI